MNTSKDNILLYLENGQEKKAIEILYKKVYPVISKYIRKNSGDEQQAEDAFHDTVLRLILKVRNKELDIKTDIKSYLFTAAKNAWITKAKRDQKIQLHDEMQRLENYASVEMNYDSVEKTKLMDEVLDTLGEACKSLLKLTFYMDYSLKEAADMLGLSSAGVAKTNQYRCKKKLFEKVKNNEPFRRLMGYE